jgi:hypothetical protein
VTSSDKTVLQLAEECSSAVRKLLKSRGVRYVPSPCRAVVEDSGPRAREQWFTLLCMSDSVVKDCWHILRMAHKVKEALRRKDAQAASLEAFRMGQLFLRLRYRDLASDANFGKTMKKGRLPKVPKAEVVRLYDEAVHEFPARKPIAIVAEKSGLSTRQIYRIIRSRG